MMAVLEKDLMGSTDVFVSTSEIKAENEQQDHGELTTSFPLRS